MRYPVPALLGALVAAGVIAAAPVASGAEGVLFVGDTSYAEPAGCIQVGDGSEVEVRNYTDSVVRVYDSPACSGEVIDILPPGERDYFRARGIRVED
ncbi:hypothetical protein OHA40_05775 [Nocardia sp. NBC_00508]|uniref:hypothetical protein n=1 Tax=Nocardia sp. NBC_00508 TaxID=2975992 RepID=UPI002E80AF20|nr:hypothetical protein [Nocardia sp. NBC_00508]WUD67637.1 hypothetical protein OHA40_05775 [Nocardia sp. NBC_00508]